MANKGSHTDSHQDIGSLHKGSSEKAFHVTAKYDTWQLGCLLFEILTGYAPPAYTESLEAYARSLTREDSFSLELPFFDFLSSIEAINVTKTSTQNQPTKRSLRQVHPNALRIWNGSENGNDSKMSGLARAMPVLASGIGAMSLKVAVPQLGMIHRGGQSANEDDSRIDPLSIAVAQKLSRFLRLHDQERNKHAHSVRDASESGSGMQPSRYFMILIPQEMVLFHPNLVNSSL